MTDDYEIVIEPGGAVWHIYDDQLAELHQYEERVTFRASHVEPTDDGWAADLSPVGGPVLGPFALRQEALEAELLWLKEMFTPGLRDLNTGGDA